jgi:5-methylcytosine-specific restriction protein A
MRMEFSAKTRALAFARANGICEGCRKMKLTVGKFDYDHIHTAAEGGDNSLENCAVLCRGCHRAKTNTDVGRMAKTERQKRKHYGIKKPRTILAWRKFNGEKVYAGRQR